VYDLRPQTQNYLKVTVGRGQQEVLFPLRNRTVCYPKRIGTTSVYERLMEVSSNPVDVSN